jgi:23S rRNA (guanosine2251-2'-O)-methyltransferase
MKKYKPFKSNRSQPAMRPTSAVGKSRRGEEDIHRTPGDARPRRNEKAKPPFKGAAKPRFKDEAKPRFYHESKPRLKSDSKRDDARPSRRDEARPARRDETRPARRDEARGQVNARPRYNDKAKPRFANDVHDKTSFKTGLKPGFRGGEHANKPIMRTTARPLTREEFKPAANTTLIWGLHAARAAWLNKDRRVHRVWLTEAGQKLFASAQEEARNELLKRPDAKKMEREELDRIIPPGSVHQGIVIEVAPLPELNLHDIIGIDPPPSLLLMLDQVTDPHNVGAILRSAAAFGAGAVIMTERNAPNTTGVLAKSASGALEHIPMLHVVNLARALDELREAGYWCVGLAEEGEKSLGEIDMSGRTVLVLGNEGEGLRHLTRQKCDELARLPTGGPIGSLNVSNAAAVALYEVRRQAK